MAATTTLSARPKKTMRVDDFDYELPSDRIAQRPARPRDSAKLLDATERDFADLTVRDLPDLLDPRDLLVINDTKVIKARLRGVRRRPDGAEAKIEATLHKPEDDGRWRAFTRPAKRLRPGDEIVFAADLIAAVDDMLGEGEVLLRFPITDAALFNALDRYGEPPLPPYIRRPNGAVESDIGDYQSLFAAKPGAVAAPTASLHMTPDLIVRLDARGVRRTALTLHVGAGTFKPVTAARIEDHKMHAEWGELSDETAQAIAACRQRGGRVVAIGTTAFRLLESAATDDSGLVAPFCGETDIFIYPGVPIRVVDILLTNFHLPKSTLLMLVSAFAGNERIQAAYAHALEHDYRFFSYGDAMLLARADADGLSSAVERTGV